MKPTRKFDSNNNNGGVDMSNLSNIEFHNNEFKCEVENDIAVLTIRGNAFKSISKIKRNADIIPLLDELEKTPSVRGLLLLNEEDSISEGAYLEFLKETVGGEFDPLSPKEISKFSKDTIRAREINILGNIVQRLTSFNKIIITGISGDIVSPFFGLTLASDFRFASTNTNFILSHIKYRLHPSGALPFFLPLYLPQSKVSEMLFTGSKYSARELKDLGLINDIYDKGEFIEKVKATANEICKVSLNVAFTTKKLLWHKKEELKNYLNIESELMMR